MYVHLGTAILDFGHRIKDIVGKGAKIPRKFRAIRSARVANSNFLGPID